MARDLRSPDSGAQVEIDDRSGQRAMAWTMPNKKRMTMNSSFEVPAVLRSRQWWAGVILRVVSTLVVAAVVFFTVPYLLVLVLAWPLLFTLATMPPDRPRFTSGAFASLFILLIPLVLGIL